jgi:hypothetical protein
MNAIALFQKEKDGSGGCQPSFAITCCSSINFWNTKVFADLAGQVVIDLAVAEENPPFLSLLGSYNFFHSKIEGKKILFFPIKTSREVSKYFGSNFIIESMKFILRNRIMLVDP